MGYLIVLFLLAIPETSAKESPGFYLCLPDKNESWLFKECLDLVYKSKEIHEKKKCNEAKKYCSII
jgi:hypothetical protein